MPFLRADDVASDSADHLARVKYGHKYKEIRKTLQDRFGGQHGVAECGGGVKAPILCEGGAQTRENLQSILSGGPSDGDRLRPLPHRDP
jgi:hypothetical protein